MLNIKLSSCMNWPILLCLNYHEHIFEAKIVLDRVANFRVRGPESIFLHFCGQILRKILNLPINFIYIAGKIFSDFSYYFFSKNQLIFAQKELFFMENSSL